jgi:hypothetical protein
MNKAETISLLMTISAAYSAFEVTNERVGVWSKHLGETDIRIAERNVSKHIAAVRYPPTIAEVTVIEPRIEKLRRSFYEDFYNRAYDKHMLETRNPETFDPDGKLTALIRYGKIPESIELDEPYSKVELDYKLLN